jgi:hypothetical protein
MTEEKMMRGDDFVEVLDRLAEQARSVKNVTEFERLVAAVRDAHYNNQLLEDDGGRRELGTFLEGIRAVIWSMVRAHEAGEPVEEPSWFMFAEIVVWAMVKD